MWCFKFRIILVCFIFANCCLFSFAQKKEPLNTYPVVGSPCPNFTLADVQYFSKTKVGLKDFKGKWLILDFWSRFCTGCISSFPKLNEIQSRVKSDLQFLLIGYNSHSSDVSIRTLFENLRVKYKLALPIAWDTSLFQKWGGLSVPFIIIIDPKGIVRGVTSELTYENIKDFINGQNPILPKINTMNSNPEKKFDQKIPLLINGNGGNDTSFLYRSLIAKWNDSIPAQIPSSISNTNHLKIYRADLKSLYRFAFFGRDFWTPSDSLYGHVFPSPLINVKDSFLFDSHYELGVNLFCYEVIVKGKNPNRFKLRQIMQNDLENYFNYKASVELLQRPYYKLIASDEASEKLKTKFPKQEIISIGVNGGYDFRNCPVKKVIENIWSAYQGDMQIIDETKINGNIDLVLKAIDTDFNDMVRALRENGLDLKVDVKEFMVLVIQDKE